MLLWEAPKKVAIVINYHMDGHYHLEKLIRFKKNIYFIFKNLNFKSLNIIWYNYFIGISSNNTPYTSCALYFLLVFIWEPHPSRQVLHNILDLDCSSEVLSFNACMLLFLFESSYFIKIAL